MNTGGAYSGRSRIARWAGYLIVAALIFLIPGSPAIGAPFDFDSAFGRLPKNVVPLEYTIAIVPDGTARRLTGSETVLLEMRAATSTIQFNTLNQTLAHVRLDGKPVRSVTTDNDKQLTTLRLAHPAALGKHTLSLTYTGEIETAPQGLFAQRYRKPDGGEGLMLTTQFESTDARRMFPCWDEPAFRATYGLTVTVPAAWLAVSNMPVARRRVQGALATTTFARTPSMPSYLVEFSAGELATIDAVRDGTAFRVVAVRGAESQGTVALANAMQILNDYNAYFGYPYPLPKLDSIAVPGGFDGAMENWGAITYNDRTLLLDATTTEADRHTVFSTQAHEMAHQWTGDLVTMGWWDDLWLNESFASWRAAAETDMRNPSWKVWEGEDAGKERAMAADARTTSHPIKVHIADELQAENAFDSEITYDKGQAFLRMLEAFLGPDVFRDGIRRYIKARAFSNATGTDLWNALSAASGTDVAALARAWTEQPGFPLVSVNATCDPHGNRMITLRQQRFMLGDDDPVARHWSVPLDIRPAPDAPATHFLFTKDGQTLAAGTCADPLSVNAGAVGFYRTAYDDATLAVNRKGFAAIPDGDRIALLDDQWALARAGKAQLSSYLALAAAMTGADARAWEQIAGALSVIERNERGQPGYDAFVTYARALLAPAIAAVGLEAKSGESPDVAELRRTVVGDLGVWGDPAAVAAANKRFAAFVTDRSSIAPDDQGYILRIVAAHADANTFAALHALARSARNTTEVNRFYSALASVRDPQLADTVLHIAVSAEIPPQAHSLREDLVDTVAAGNPEPAWEFFKNNYAAIVEPVAAGSEGFIAQSLPQVYWRGAPLAEIAAFVEAKLPAGIRPFLAKGMERAAFDLNEARSIVPETDQYVAAQGLVNRAR